MRKYVCTVCGYVYDEAAGSLELGIDPGTRFEDLPDDWSCPICGADQDAFEAQAVSPAPATQSQTAQQGADESLSELSPAELSVLCSNLSKGCEKQYRLEEAGLFSQLADYFTTQSRPADSIDFEDLAEQLRHDIDDQYPKASAVAKETEDRGALRALVWSEKVSRIESSLLNRFSQQQDALLDQTNLYVCEICGFVFVGDDPPAICPICKVPSLKISQVAREVI